MHKHGVSGHAGRSPRYKHNQMIEAQKGAKRKKEEFRATRIQDLVDHKHPGAKN